MLRTLTLGSFAFIAGLAALATAADWPQWRGPDRTGLSSETGLLPDWDSATPKLLWMSEGCGEGYASVAVAAGKVYTTGNLKDGQGVICFDTDGKHQWSATVTTSTPKHGYNGARCTPTIDGDRLYVVLSDGSISCLKTADGASVWRREFKEWKGRMSSGWGFSESPLVDGDLVLCTPGADDAMIVALNKLTGEEVWRTAVPDLGESGKSGAAYSSIVISNAAGVKQYVQLIGKGVIGVRASDGKFLWGYNEIANKTANIPTCIVTGDYVFTSTGYDVGGSALLRISADGDGAKVEEVWYKPANELQNHHGGMVLVGDRIYFGAKHNNGFPVCVDFMNKENPIVWGGKERGPGGGSAAVTYADGNLIFRYQDGTVALVEANPTEYKLKGKFKAEHQERESWAHPVVSGGKLYLREQDKLMCYSLKAE